MPNVRPAILRRFYAARLGGPDDDAVVYDGATFDEYYELARIQYARISRRTAAEQSPIERFRALASSLPAEVEAAPLWPALHTARLDRRPALDLAAETIDGATERLIIDRTKSVTGWSALTKHPKLRHLYVQLCGGGEGEAEPTARAAIDTVEIKECTPSCVKAVLRATSARSLAFYNPGVASFDLSILAGHPDLRELSTGAPILRGLEVLQGRPLESLSLGVAQFDDKLRRVLERLAPTLESLSITCTAGFDPKSLPDLRAFRKLQRFVVGIAPEYRDAWLDYAVAHPAVSFQFGLLQPSGDAAVISVAEVYRGIDILQIARGKKRVFEVSGDLASEVDAGNNEELEDRMKAAAKRAKKKLRWSSEADCFVAQTADVETSRWLVDALHGDTGDAPAPAKKTAKSAGKKPR